MATQRVYLLGDLEANSQNCTGEQALENHRVNQRVPLQALLQCSPYVGKLVNSQQALLMAVLI